MIYQFECPVCGQDKEVVRCAADSGLKEICLCGSEMKRVWTSPQVSVPSGGGYYNHGLGVWVNHKSDVKDAVRRIGDGGSRVIPRVDECGKVYTEKVDVPGREIIEVGNENAKVKSNRVEY